MLPSTMANVYVGLGEIDKAFDWMEKAVDDCDGGIIHSHLSPLYDAIRSHPRYRALLRKMNLEP